MSDDVRERLRGLPVFDGDLPSFDVDRVPEEPAELFLAWLGEAIDTGVRAPHAMTLSTVDAYGHPNARVLILKGLENGRWEFATSRGSHKGRELTTVASAAATFHWPELARQVRIRGRVADAGSDAARRDFLARPDESRAESLHGRQSEPLDDPAELDAAFQEGLQRVAAEPELVPAHWTLYQLVGEEAEFWQGRADRRHVRLRYRHEGGRWVRRLLWP